MVKWIVGGVIIGVAILIKNAVEFGQWPDN